MTQDRPRWRQLTAASHAAHVAWRDLGVARRLEVLHHAGRALDARVAELHDGLRADGLSTSLAQFYGQWITHTASGALLSAHARELVRRVPVDDGEEYLVRRADGVVLMIAPSKSPTINSAALFPILLAGNAVIVRAPPNDTGLRFVAETILGAAFETHGVPRDLLTVVTGSSRAIISDVLPAPEVRTVVFFGNADAGRAVGQRAYELGKKSVLELEGNDHMALWSDADVARAVASASHAFDFSTMPCPIPKHILVHERAFDAFVDAFGARANGCRTIAQDPAVGVLAPLPHPDAFDAALVELREVGTVVTGGYRMQADGSRDANGAYAAPTIALMDADICFKRSLRCFDEEVFFPLIPVVRFKGSDAQIQSDMVELVRRGPFGLRMSLWTETESVLAYFARNVDNTGLLIFNDEHAQCPRHAAPWGGPGRSGGPGGESHFFWEKTSHLQAIAARRLAPAQRSAILGALGHVPASRSPTTGESETRLTIDGNVATVELCRPERHNAVTPRMKDELAQHVATLRTRLDTLSCVVIRGAGKSFCSGADLDLLDGFDVDTARRFMMEATWVFRALGRLPVPVVAAVTGFCMGGGVELALHCDLVIAASDATFALPEAQLGLITTAGSITRLSEIVGHAAARDMVLTGRRISGRQAHAMGLVARVVEPGELDGAIATACQAFSEQPRAGLAAAKQIFRELGAASHAHGWTRETEAFCDLMESRGSHAS